MRAEVPASRMLTGPELTVIVLGQHHCQVWPEKLFRRMPSVCTNNHTTSHYHRKYLAYGQALPQRNGSGGELWGQGRASAIVACPPEKICRP